LKKGHIWQVGDGNSIDIWDDEWIPNNNSRKVFTRKGQNLITKVSELINPVTNQWDEELIDQTFWNIDSCRIKAIPLPSHDISDFVAYNLTKNGIFSVRSVYHAEWEMQYGRKINIGQAPRSMNSHPMWEKIWKL
jgi:hypothetical protein